MAIVSYNGCRIIPAPLVSINKSYASTSDGKQIGTVWSISVKGSILTYKGSPDTSSTFYTGSDYPPDDTVALNEEQHLGRILRKQEAIRKLFATEGKSFEIQSFDGSAPMKCNPRIKSIIFPEGKWFNIFEYEIQLETDIISVNGVPLGEDSKSDGSNIFNDYISALEDNWQIETQEEPVNDSIPRTYRVTHTLSATGKRFYDENGVLTKEAWQQAKSAIIPRLGLDMNFLTMSGIGDIPQYFSGYNYLRSENIGASNGTYGITETWFMSSGHALENFTIDVKRGIDNSFSRVGIQGLVKGLEIRDSGMNLIQSKFVSASGKFNEIKSYVYDRAKQYSKLNHLHYIPISHSFVLNPFDGTVQYTYEYDDRPSGLISHALSENITIQNSFDNDVFAAIPVLGRKVGPVLQSINTKKETTRSLNIDIIFDKNLYIGDIGYTIISIPHPRFTEPYKTEIQNLVDRIHPVKSQLFGIPTYNNIGQVVTRAFINDQNENWNPNTFHYTFNISWVFE